MMDADVYAMDTNLHSHSSKIQESQSSKRNEPDVEAPLKKEIFPEQHTHSTT